MASKAIYAVVAVAGIALASGAAWWYQKPRTANGAPAGAGQAAGGT
ncbi:MAG: efflux transporter periplasmic adaptor subunit, partial [Polaromonas sp.]|nr:efflux transporter periplasmic adaptor subunit [Polaromonas sp.]